MDKKEGSGSHNWGTFEDEMKAEEDKANTSTDMNESAVEADAKEETAAEPVNTAEDEEAAARRVMIFVPINPRLVSLANHFNGIGRIDSWCSAEPRKSSSSYSAENCSFTKARVTY